MTDIPPLLRTRLTPSLTDWMDWLCPQIDDGMLEQIAAADYGYRADEQLTALRLIRDDRQLPDRVATVPLEVLELIRWSQPEDPLWQPGGQGRRGHLMRLFCCAALLAAGDKPEVRYLEEAPTLPQLVDSAVKLGEPAVEAMLPLLCRRVQTLPPTEEDRPFFAASILLLAAARYRDEGDAPLLRELCRWVIDEEARYRTLVDVHIFQLREAWLLGLKSWDYGDDLWRELARRLLLEPAAPVPPAAAAALREVGSRLVLGESDSAEH